jgi:TRAP-type C4-dicarboxylate transport system substrate-binding protein
MNLAKLLAAGTLITLTALSATTSAWAETVTLRYSNWLAANYPLHARAMVPWMKDIEEATEGRVKFDVTPKVVGTVAGQYDVAAQGLADVVLFLPGYQPGRFVLMEGLDLPFLGSDTTKRCPATWRTYQRFVAPKNEFKDVVPLSVYCSTSGQIGTTRTTIDSLASVKGLKIRSASEATTAAITLLGATPVQKPASELYELLSGGVIDGAIFPLDSMVGFKVDSVLKHVAYMQGGFNSSMVLIGMNKDAWAKIPEADQKIIMDLSGEALATRVGKMLAVSEQEAREKIVAGGGKVIDVDSTLVQQFEQAVLPVRQAWVEKAKAAGLENPEEMLDYLRGEIEK